MPFNSRGSQIIYHQEFTSQGGQLAYQKRPHPIHSLQVILLFTSQSITRSRVISNYCPYELLQVVSQELTKDQSKFFGMCRV